MLQFGLVENHFTAAPNDFTTQTVNVRSVGLDEMYKRIMARNPGLGLSQLQSATEEIIEEVCRIVEEGNAVNTPLFNAQPSIAGVFHGANDNFDPKRHRVKTNLTAGTRLKKATAAIKTQKTIIQNPLPYILEVHDMLSDTVNDAITPGGVLQIWGGRLKLFTANPDNGIFLTDETGKATKLNMVVENKPARLIAMLPAELAPGTYNLEVRTTLTTSSKETKTMKTGRFAKELTAVSD
jgi:hypothetical protein